MGDKNTYPNCPRCGETIIYIPQRNGGFSGTCTHCGYTDYISPKEAEKINQELQKKDGIRIIPSSKK